MRPKFNDGGPAFPCEWDTQLGMNLRDWFAGQAVVGLYAGRGGQFIQEQHFAEDARLAYAAADAMLAARKAGVE